MLTRFARIYGVKIMVPFWGPYYKGPNTGPNLGDPKRDHNFDNPPYEPTPPSPPALLPLPTPPQPPPAASTNPMIIYNLGKKGKLREV